MRAAVIMINVSLCNLCCHGMTFMRVLIGQAGDHHMLWFQLVLPQSQDSNPYVSIRSGMVTFHLFRLF